MQEVSKAMPLDDLSGAVSAYQSSSEPVVLDNVEITNPKTYLTCRPMKYYRNYLINL